MRNKGFTLIEITVAVAIITLLPAIIISNFPEIKMRFALSRAVHQFVQDIRDAQNMALSASSEGGLGFIAGYGVYADLVSLGNKKYIIYADSNEQGAANFQYDAADFIVKTVDLEAEEPGIVIKEIKKVLGDNLSVNFIPPNPNTAITQLEEEEESAEVVFAVESDLEKTKTVFVNKSGLAEIKR